MVFSKQITTRAVAPSNILNCNSGENGGLTNSTRCLMFKLSAIVLNVHFKGHRRASSTLRFILLFPFSFP